MSVKQFGVRKTRNKDEYKVFDKASGDVVCVCGSKREATRIAKDEILTGGKINATSLKKILRQTYNQTTNDRDVPGYTIDEKLSGKRVKVYKHNDSGEVVVGIRGTKSIQDVFTNMKLFVTPKSQVKELKRFKHADKVLKEAEEKYGAENITVTGHSLAGRIAEVVGSEKNKNIITFNKAVLPFQNKTDKPNQIDIRTTNDPVSFLDKPDDNDIVLESKSYNPLYEHSLAALDKYLPGDLMIGSGLIDLIGKKIKKFPIGKDTKKPISKAKK